MTLKKLQQILFGLIVFTGSSNLFYKFLHPDIYVQGWLVDYLIPKFYLSDFFILAFIIVFFFAWLKGKKPSFFKVQFEKRFSWPLFITFLILLTGLFLRQFTALVPLAAFYYFFKLLEFGLLAFALYHSRKIFTARYLFWLFTSLLFFQVLLGLYQFLTQKPLFPYYIFGETNLSQPLGLPRTALFTDQERVLPYGTFSHPNILAGISVLSFLIAASCRRFFTPTKLTSILFYSSVFFLSLALLLTQSLSAFLTLGLGIICLIFSRRLFSVSFNHLLPLFAVLLLLFVPLSLNFLSQTPLNSHLSLTRRTDLQLAALQLFTTFPLEGSGLNQFVPHLPTTHPQGAAQINFHQPVHNLPLLWLSETGLLGLTFLTCLYFLLRPIKKESWLTFLILIPLFSLDHYLLTTQSGLLFLIIFLAIFPQFLIRDSE